MWGETRGGGDWGAAGASVNVCKRTGVGQQGQDHSPRRGPRADSEERPRMRT